VTFHDGTPWDANSCKANFDQVFDPALIKYHGWYDLPKRIKSWEVRAIIARCMPAAEQHHRRLS
jgi:hypothetical protein